LGANAKRTGRKGRPRKTAAPGQAASAAGQNGSETPGAAGGSEGGLPPGTALEIRKYPNRRFYDTTRSRHVTLADLHALILAGHDLHVTDAQSGADITHAILTQIILENEAPKLELFPVRMLHQIIRTQRQFLGDVMADFFRGWLEAQRRSQQQWMEVMSQLFGGLPRGDASGGQVPNPWAAMNPLEWTQRMMQTWAQGGSQAGGDKGPRQG
jgi:polyhydroxyalkanoate synthesis repressor PhaR